MLVLPAVYLLSRKLLNAANSLLATLFIAIDPFQAEMIVTGALPLIAMSLYLFCLWGIIDIIQKKVNILNVSITIISLALIPFINQTTAGIIFVILPFVFLQIFCEEYLNFWNKFNFRKYIPLVSTVFIGGLISLFSLPYYLKVLPGSELMSYPGAWVYLAHDGVAWFTFLTCGFLGIYIFNKSSNLVPRIFAIHLILMGTLALFLSYDETIINVFYRSRYFVRFFFYSSLIWVFLYLQNKQLIKPFIPKLISTFFIYLLIFTYGWTFNTQSEYSKTITKNSEIAIEIMEGSGHENVISNSFSMSLWVSALMKVQSPHIWTSEPPSAHTETDQKTRCVLNWIKDCDYEKAIENLNVSHVLLETRFPYYKENVEGNYLAPANQWEVTNQASWLDLIYEKGTTRLYRINNGIN